MLILCVIIYLIFFILIGLYSSLGIKNSSDYILAGRSVPLYMTITTVFATWFGSEAVLSIPATFIQNGLTGLVVEPLGAGFCLIFVGMFFAARLYKMKLVTIGDFYRQRFGRLVEFFVSITICISYLGWLAAQVIALGMMINLVSNNTVSFEFAMMLGIGTVITYTIFGGMRSIVNTDFYQMIIILIGLVSVAFLISNRFEGGFGEVLSIASSDKKFNLWLKPDITSFIVYEGGFLTIALGSIPQQDVFQRVMSAKDAKTAVNGTILGGTLYILFCFVPIFITYGVFIMQHDAVLKSLAAGDDLQQLLPNFILVEAPMFLQILFFGALLSAIMSTASGALLAPSVVIAENILRERLKLNDKGLILTVKCCILGFGVIVYFIAYACAGTGITILEIIKNAYLMTLCGAFVPLAFGVYWKKATNEGAIFSIILGVGTLAILKAITLFCEVKESYFIFEIPQLVGLVMAIVGMIIGSLLPKECYSAIKLKG